MKTESKEYIPLETAETSYYEPQTEQEMEEIVAVMNVGDMILNIENNLWYTMGLIDKDNPEAMCLFPNIIMDEELKPLSR